MTLLGNKEKEAGLDQLPDGRWTYTPINIFGRNKKGKKYLVSENKKEEIIQAYKRICFFIPFYTTSILFLLYNHLWSGVIMTLITGVIYAVFVQYRFKRFSNGLPLYQDEHGVKK